jgi:hypothetical protein
MGFTKRRKQPHLFRGESNVGTPKKTVAKAKSSNKKDAGSTQEKQKVKALMKENNAVYEENAKLREEIEALQAAQKETPPTES